MSLQLIVYPQSYEGQINSTSSATSVEEFIVDGISFATVNALAISSANLAGTFQDVPSYFIGQGNALPTNINQWYTARDTNGTTVLAPVQIGSELVMYLDQGPNTGSIIYQRLSNLTVGANYEFRMHVSVDSPTNRQISLRSYNGDTQGLISITPNLFNFGSGSISTFFVAQTTEDIVCVYYNPTSTTSGTGTDNPLTIDLLTVTPTGFQPTTTTTLLGDGQVICDLYEDEDIPLTLSVDDFKNVAEKVQSYSKAFKIPGTKRNNQIFNNIFDVTRVDDGVIFNPYVKTKSILKQDGFVLFEGYLRLIAAQEKDGEISYNVNLYSEVVALADILKGRTFLQLGFEELAHEYNKTNILASWTGSVTYTIAATGLSFRSADTLKYPFVDWNHQMLVADGFTGTLANLDYPELTFLEQAFRPFIQIKYLIERIFDQPDFPFSYTSEFFDTDDDFAKLYMDFNWGADTTGAAPLRNDFVRKESNLADIQYIPIGSYNRIKMHLPGTPAGNTSLWDNVDYRFVSDVNNLEVTGSFRIQLENTSGASYDATMRLVKCNVGGAVIETLQAETKNISGGGSGAISGSFSTTLNSGEFIQSQAAAWHANAFEDIQQSTNTTCYINVYYNNNASLVVPLLTKIRGEIDQWNFFKGILTMFNLVTIPDKSDANNILIEPYTNVFIKNTNSGDANDLTLASRSIAHDWTDKIDISQIKLTPLKELNKTTVFKFVEDDEDYIFNVYKNSCSGGVSLLGLASEGHLYGSLIFDASTSATGLDSILTGSKEIIPEPFAATVIKPLMSQFSELITPAVYAYDADEGTSKGFDNAPRIMYNNGVKTMPSTTYWIPDQNGVTGENTAEFLQFSHLTDVPTIVSNPPVGGDTLDFHFGECQLINPVGDSTPNNLFNLYWLPYFAELYNPNTRAMSLKVNLSPGDINGLQMFDTVFIKNRQFRINKIEYKPNDLAQVEFILLP